MNVLNSRSDHVGRGYFFKFIYKLLSHFVNGTTCILEYNLEGAIEKVHKFCTTFFKNWVRSASNACHFWIN